MAIETDDTEMIQQNHLALVMSNPHVMPTTTHISIVKGENQISSMDMILKGGNIKSYFN